MVSSRSSLALPDVRLLETRLRRSSPCSLLLPRLPSPRLTSVSFTTTRSPLAGSPASPLLEASSALLLLPFLLSLFAFSTSLSASPFTSRPPPSPIRPPPPFPLLGTTTLPPNGLIGVTTSLPSLLSSPGTLSTSPSKLSASRASTTTPLLLPDPPSSALPSWRPSGPPSYPPTSSPPPVPTVSSME